MKPGRKMVGHCVCRVSEGPRGGRILAPCVTGSKEHKLWGSAGQLLDVLERILMAHDSGNNGLINGEAMLCGYFAEQARAAVKNAGGRTLK